MAASQLLEGTIRVAGHPPLRRGEVLQYVVDQGFESVPDGLDRHFTDTERRRWSDIWDERHPLFMDARGNGSGRRRR